MMTQEQACVRIPRGHFPGFWREMKVVTAQAFHQQQHLAAIALQVLVVMLCAWAPSIAQVFIRHRESTQQSLRDSSFGLTTNVSEPSSNTMPASHR